MRHAEAESVLAHEWESEVFKLHVREYSVQKGDLRYENNMEDGSVGVVWYIRHNWLVLYRWLDGFEPTVKGSVCGACSRLSVN